MMVRTQVYLPKKMHAELKAMAKDSGVTLSHLIRRGARTVAKRKKISQQQKALQTLLEYTDSYRKPLSKTSVQLIREDRRET